MKILLIHPFIQLGGGELVILRLANYFVKKGYTVGIACCFVNNQFLDTIDTRITFYTPPAFIAHFCQQQRLFLATIGFFILLIQTTLLSFSFDILFPHNFPSIFFAAIGKFFSNKKILWEYNEGAQLPKSLAFLEEFSAKQSDEMIVLDNKNKKVAKKRFQKNASVIRPGIDFTYWSGKAVKDKKYNNKTILLSVGKLHPQKNQILLLDVLVQVLPKIPSLHLVLVGTGPDFERITRRIHELHLEKYVTLTGSISNPQLRNLYHSAFLVCFPALDQTWGLTPFEALCQQTVSIVSSEAGAAEVLSPNKIALIADPTSEDFSKEIIKAYRNKATLMKIGKKGYRYVKENLTWENFYEGVENVMQKNLINKRVISSPSLQ